MASKVALLVLIAALVVAPSAEAALNCGNVVTYLSPCLGYVTNRGPLGGCCGGVNNLYRAARTTGDRRTVCTCLKNLAGTQAGINYGKAAGLPGLCRVNIPYKIDPKTDCSRVN